MKQNESSLRRQTYLPPCAEIIQIESQTVLCASGGAQSGVGTTNMNVQDGFGWI